MEEIKKKICEEMNVGKYRKQDALLSINIPVIMCGHCGQYFSVLWYNRGNESLIRQCPHEEFYCPYWGKDVVEKENIKK